MVLPFRVEYLDTERLLPVLVRKAAWRAVTKISEGRWSGPTCARRARERWRNRWSVRAKGCRNYHCAPTIKEIGGYWSLPTSWTASISF